MRFTVESLQSFRKNNSPETLAGALDLRARQIERESSDLYVELGLICCAVEDCWLALKLPFPNFSAWLADAMPTSQSTAREAKTVYRNCHLPESEMREIPRGKLKLVSQCSPAVQKDPGVREKAKGRDTTERGLVDYINKTFENQHLEARDLYHFAFTPEERDVVDAAIADFRIIVDEPQASPQEAIYHICRLFHEDRGHMAAAKRTSNVGSEIVQ